MPPASSRSRASRAPPTSAWRSAATARSSRACAASPAAAVPVFGINYGTVGFLAAAEAEDLERGLGAAFAADFETIELPGLEAGAPGERSPALNDISFTRRPHHRVAELSYRLGGREVGHVRCDGLVAATPVGSTGYNLANGGPILAWGVEGYVVSFIAPHTLTVARARRRARRRPARPQRRLRATRSTSPSTACPPVSSAPGGAIEIRFRDGVARLAQLEGETFYRRIREKFGRLAQ